MDMDKLGDINHHCSDSGTCLKADVGTAATAWWPRRAESRAEAAVTDDAPTWYPRLLSWYGLTESAHWSRRLDADIYRPTGRSPDARPRPPRPAANRRDYYGREDADAAFLCRKPVSFAVFGKPGMPDDRVAAALAAYWGCVHVSAANGLPVAAASGSAAAELRRGSAVNAACTAERLVEILGLACPGVRERGYVLTGLPRHVPQLSVYAQMDAVFDANPPDVLIYLSCPDEDLHAYRNGLILASTRDDYLTQTLHADGRDYRSNNLRYVHWYKSPRENMIAELDTVDFKTHSSVAVEEIVKLFDPGFVITVDGRKPFDQLFEVIRARLLSMPLQRTVIPEIVERKPDDVRTMVTDVRSENDRGPHPDEMGDENEEFEAEMHEEHNTAVVSTAAVESTTNAYGDDGEGSAAGDQVVTLEARDAEQVRLLSEFGRLCPVSFFHGQFKLGRESLCVKFMGKLYYFAGPEQMRVFHERPRRFLDVPRPGLPVKAVFYGPQMFSGPTATAVSSFFRCDLIDVDRMRRVREKRAKREHVSAIVDSVFEMASEIEKIKESGDVAVMRNAVGDWMRLYFGAGSSDDSAEAVDEESQHEILENSSNNETQMDELAKDVKLMSLKNYFESYGIDFIDDLDASKHAYDEPETLIKYLKNRPKINKSKFTSNVLNENTAPFQLIDDIINTVRTKNEQNNNWIIVNAPLDILLTEKLNAEDLSPIQMVFFHDTDPMHKVLLSDQFSDDQISTIIRETSENVKNERRHGTMAERINYPEFVKQNENSSNIYRDEYQLSEDHEMEFGEHDEHDNNISHELLMEVILPEIIERLNQYTENLLVQWNALKIHISKTMGSKYMDFHVIESKPDSTTNAIKILIEDTVYHIKKFLLDNVYDVSMTTDDTTPTKGKYDGDTSIYCPVMFANGKLSVGSKEHMAVYQNRYYYMKSHNYLKAFIANPKKYASFTSVPELYPKPKLSLFCPFGYDNVDLFKSVLDEFDLTLVDSYKTFKHKVLPKNTPMLGEMYEEPNLKEIIRNNFVPADEKNDYVNSLRNYVDKKSSYLSDENWVKMNSVFIQTEEGICYKNYPANLTELMYLKENEINPNVIVQVDMDEREKREYARKAIVKNWLAYQYAMVENVVARDGETRRNTVKERSMRFKNKIAELKREKYVDSVKTRIENIIEITAAETEYGPDSLEYEKCDSWTGSSELSATETPKRNSTLSLSSSAYAALTLKQKIIIVKNALTLSDLSDLEDFESLERIDSVIGEQFPEPELLISQCFLDNFEPPADSVIDRWLEAEKSASTDMREYAESHDIPWLTVSADRVQGRPSSHSVDDVARVLRDGYDGDGALETAYAVDLETAERMLCAGEAYLSRFGRRCPVQANEHPDSARTFYADCADGRACPVVYRKYVYYASGPENRDRFARRPLEYARRPCNGAAAVVVPPLRIAVLGPPNSGKSRCAQELSERHGLQLIRVGGPLLRAYLSAVPWTCSARKAAARLYRGRELSDVTLTAAVRWAAQTARAVTQGYVIDGFPVTRKQFALMDESGVLLHRAFVLPDSGGRHTVFQNDKKATVRRDDHGDGGAVSDAMLRHRYTEWERESAGERWLSERYGNAVVAVVAGPDQMDASVSECVRSLREYGSRVPAGLPCGLAGLPVGARESRNKMSMYLDACPVCRTDDGVLNRPPDREALTRGLVQYRHYLYCVCPRHRDRFCEAGRARQYADAAPPVPEVLPVMLSVADVRRLVHDDAGCFFRDACVVCTLARPWHLTPPSSSRGVDQQQPMFAAKYIKYAYAFCSSACRRRFMCRPWAYYAYGMPRLAGVTPLGGSLAAAAAVDRLPTLGYLEQAVGAHVSRALVRLTATRPLFPGLSARVTAMVFVGLCIGCTGADPDLNDYYLDALRRFADTCHCFKMEVLKLQLIQHQAVERRHDIL